MCVILENTNIKGVLIVPFLTEIKVFGKPNPLEVGRYFPTMTCIPKGAFKKASRNPNVRVAQNYSVVEDLSQTPCVMSTLEVLQSCPSQRKDLLATLGSVETCNPGTIMLDITVLKPRLPFHIVF